MMKQSALTGFCIDSESKRITYCIDDDKREISILVGRGKITLNISEFDCILQELPEIGKQYLLRKSIINQIKSEGDYLKRINEGIKTGKYHSVSGANVMRKPKVLLFLDDDSNIVKRYSNEL